MSKIMISELQETTSAPDSSYIAIDNGTTTNKITIANYNTNANATAKRYAEASQGYSNEALTAKDGAVSAKNEAETLANTASSYANAARASADAAAGSASEASGYVGSAQASATNALASARAAEASAAGIDNQVKLAKSWAVGNTGVRADEAVNNAMYWAGQAAAAAGGGVVSFNGRTGSVLPNAGDYSSDQIAHVNSDSTYSNVETEINNLQTSRLKTYASDATQWDAAPTANSTKPVTSGGIKAQLDLIGTQITDINEDITDVNAEIADLHTEDSRLSSQISKLANIYTYSNPTDILNSNAPVISAYAIKQGRIVNISIIFSNYRFVQGDWTILGTLTPKFRPAIQQNFNAVSNTDGRSFQTRIDQNGSIQIWVPSAITHSPLVSLTYFAANSDH